MLHILTFVGFVTVAAGGSLYDELMTVNCTSYLEWVDKTNLTSLLMGEEGKFCLQKVDVLLGTLMTENLI